MPLTPIFVYASDEGVLRTVTYTAPADRRFNVNRLPGIGLKKYRFSLLYQTGQQAIIHAVEDGFLDELKTEADAMLVVTSDEGERNKLNLMLKNFDHQSQRHTALKLEQ